MGADVQQVGVLRVIRRYVFQRKQGVALLFARGRQGLGLAVFNLRQYPLRVLFDRQHVDAPRRVVGDAHVHQARLQHLARFVREGQRQDVFGREAARQRFADAQGQRGGLGGARVGDDKAGPAPRGLDPGLFFGGNEAGGEELGGRGVCRHLGGKGASRNVAGADASVTIPSAGPSNENGRPAHEAPAGCSGPKRGSYPGTKTGTKPGIKPRAKPRIKPRIKPDQRTGHPYIKPPSRYDAFRPRDSFSGLLGPRFFSKLSP
ncbi:hypothetical protein D3C85_544700 [compost metagenome]